MGRRVILASASPRRQELLKMIYPQFEVQQSDCNEETENLSPKKMVMELAKRKALSVAALNQNTSEELIIIGSDTVVAVDEAILGKPKDHDDAVQMLKKLSGRVHSVYTGVALVSLNRQSFKEEAVCEVFAEETKVEFVSMTDDEIETYVNTGEPMDKAGAYGIQGCAGKFISSISGDYYNVVGLPVAALYQRLKKKGMLGF